MRSKLRFDMRGMIVVLLFVSIVGCERAGSLLTQRETFPSAVWREDAIAFTDPALGVSIDVPVGWTLQPHIQGPANPHPVDAFLSPCQSWAPEVLPPCTKIELTAVSSSVRDLDELRELREGEVGSSAAVILEQRELSLSGGSGLWLTLLDESVSEHPRVEVMILMDERLIQVNAYGELAPVTDVVDSIRPVEEVARK